MTARLLAIDPSLTCSGWVVFSIEDAQPLSCGTLRASSAQDHLSVRLQRLQAQMDQLFQTAQLGSGDVLVCEGPAPLVLNPQSALKVEHVRTMFETLARGRGMLVPGRLNPRTVQTELLGLRGKQADRKSVKESARAVCEKMFGQSLHDLVELVKETPASSRRNVLSQDIVDAALIGAVALSRVQLANKLNVPLEDFFCARSSRAAFRTNGSKRLGWSDAQMRKRFLKS